MANKVGTKGQVVIEKEIRERLGVQPGWEAIQIPAEDHVKIYFIPPPHNRSLFGAARPFIQRWPSPDEDRDEDWDEAIGNAIAEEWMRKTTQE